MVPTSRYDFIALLPSAFFLSLLLLFYCTLYLLLGTYSYALLSIVRMVSNPHNDEKGIKQLYPLDLKKVHGCIFPQARKI